MFQSRATGLVPGQVDTQSSSDLFLFDRLTGAVSLISHAAGSTATAAGGTGASISADGRYTVFSSSGTNLAAGVTDGNAGLDVFLHDRVTGATSLISRSAVSPGQAAAGASSEPAISANGEVVGFHSTAADLIAGNADDAYRDLFLYDRVTGGMVLASHASSSPNTASNEASARVALSADGRYASYKSWATNLVSPGHTDFFSDIFLYDRATGINTLVSHAAGSAAPGDRESFEAVLSADGRRVAFWSAASNLVPGQVDGTLTRDVFVFDRLTGTTSLVNRRMDAPATPVYASFGDFGISTDGCAVAFTSHSDEVVPGDLNYRADAFVDPLLPFGADLAVATAGGARAIPGQALAFTVTARNLGPCATTDAVVSDDFPAALQGVSWTCAPSPGSVCTPSGAGDLADTVTLLPGGSAVYTVTGTVAPGATGTLTHTARVATVAGVPDPQAANDEVTDTDVVSAQPLGTLSTLPPCRLLDTRLAADGPALASGVTETLTVAGRCGVPPTATAIAVNVTVTQSTGTGHLIFHPGGQPPGLTSTINFGAGQTRANNAILTLAANGGGTLSVTPAVSGNGTVHVIVDISGFFE